MPPVFPRVARPPGPAVTARRDRAARVRFRRAMALMLMTLVLPGSAQLVAGNSRSAGSRCGSGSSLVAGRARRRS